MSSRGVPVIILENARRKRERKGREKKTKKKNTGLPGEKQSGDVRADVRFAA